MKLAPLLTQYLYLNKRLDLPGIGSFLLDPSVIVDFESKHHRPTTMLDGVSFESNPSLKNAGGVVEYIATKTGKMKALASSDLESHLQLARQFLNIGKPFLFEGIGSLVKMRSGEFAFTSGQIMPDKMREYSAREISATSTTEDSFSNYKNVFSPSKIMNWSKPFVFLLMIAGVAFAIWGGYKVYKTTTASKEGPVAAELSEKTIDPPVDTIQNNITDTTQTIKQNSAVVPVQRAAIDSYKVVLEITNAKRAATRYAQLKSFQWKIQMEAKDSAAYKLFLRVPVTGTDTIRLKDSLFVLYGRKVYFER